MFDLKFYRLMKERNKSENHYFAFEKYQGEKVVNFFKKNNIAIKNKLLLDLASGRGGYSIEFINAGARVISLDLKIPSLYDKKSSFVNGDVTCLPFKSSSFDIIFCSSLIEHLSNPDLLLKEIKRALKKDGVCYLSFPPFYSPVGGHQFKPFHYLPEKIAAWLSRKINKTRSYRYNDEYGRLYKLRIYNVKKLILENNLRIENISTRFFPFNLAKIPLLNEFLTWNIEFILKKP